MEDVLHPFFSLCLKSFLLLPLQLLLLLPFKLLLLLEFVSVLHELVVHLVINQSIKYAGSDDVAPLRSLVFEGSYHVNLDLKWLRSLEPLGSNALISDSFKEPLILQLVFDQGLDLPN